MRGPVRSSLVAGLGLLAALVALSPRPSAAGNAEHPRTPVLWPDAPCIQTVDRSVDPLFEFAYAIPFEDTNLSFDEFEDSRTHQFIGFCRQWPAGRPPPRYVSVYDLERAIAAGFEEHVSLDDPEATLETSVAWAGCWTRITADDQRRPITYAAAAEPIVWDTSGVAAGTWMVAGYTWEPQFNLWSRAPWVLRVVEQAEQAEQDPPVQAAASLADTADTLYFDESLELELCVDAGAGATVELEWSSTKLDPPQWSPVASVALEAGGGQTLSLPFAPPEPSWGAMILLRARVEPLDAPAYAAHALAPLIVFAPASDDDDGGADESGETGSGDESGDSGEDPTGETGDAEPAGDASARAGRCSLAPERGNLATLVFALVLLAPRRSPRGRLAPAPESPQ